MDVVDVAEASDTIDTDVTPAANLKGNLKHSAKHVETDGVEVGAREASRHPKTRVEAIVRRALGPLRKGAWSAETVRFPAGFLWGVATAGYQYEGGLANCTWDRWEREGHIKTGDTCGDACDWWRNAEADLDRAAALGVNALRLSVEWSRLEPAPGVWDGAAFARYREILRGLRDRGIEPLVTLHHFADPLWFADQGGFLAKDAVERFSRYAERVVGELGDLCDFWCTINEPNIYSSFGYHLGEFPPGRSGDIAGAIRAQAALARAHAAAYRVIHQAQPGARVGWAHHYNIFDPFNPRSPLDRLPAAALDRVFNDFFPHALYRGRARFPFSLLAGDLSEVRDTYDYVGINVYARDYVIFSLSHWAQLFGKRYVAPGAPRGDQGMSSAYGEAYPNGVLRVARRASALGKPIYVTENGVADATDRLRPWLIIEAARAMGKALSEGIDLRGYFHWSLVDNFEWSEGWGQHYGLYALDPITQRRTPRRSAALYREVVHANALTPDMVERFAPESTRALAAVEHVVDQVIEEPPATAPETPAPDAPAAAPMREAMREAVSEGGWPGESLPA